MSGESGAGQSVQWPDTMMKSIEKDPESQAEVYQLTDAQSGADNVYCEQPYGSADGSRVLVRHYDRKGRPRCLVAVDLTDDTHIELHQYPASSVPHVCPMPAFAAWSDWVYVHEPQGDGLALVAAHFNGRDRRTVCQLPRDQGLLGYGTVSSNGRWYVVTAGESRLADRLLAVDMTDGCARTLYRSTGDCYLNHEQFALDGSHRLFVLVVSHDRSNARLLTMSVDEPGETFLTISAPYTLKCTGHACWVTGTDCVLTSTRYDEGVAGNLWSVRVGAEAPKLVCRNHTLFGHVSASRCGRFWIADGYHEPGTPIYIGAVDTGRYRRLITSQTSYRGPQEAHTHPYLTADNRHLIFTSDRTGTPQVYAVRVPAAFLESLLTDQGCEVSRPIPTSG